jgi:hypothetical protein
MNLDIKCEEAAYMCENSGRFQKEQGVEPVDPSTLTPDIARWRPSGEGIPPVAA